MLNPPVNQPKTIVVNHKLTGGEVRINESDYDAEVHVKPRPKIMDEEPVEGKEKAEGSEQK